MTSDETPVERRLRAMLHGIEYDELIGADPKAIDCGREAIRLLREMPPVGAENATAALVRLKFEATALLARCTEGPR